MSVTYQPDKRVMFKVKHERTADCVVAGYRVHKSGADAIGSLLLGLYQPDGQLASVGVIGAFPMAERRRLFAELQPLVTEFDQHPWNWAAHESGERTPRKNEGSRWNAGKDLSFVPLRPERVVEVRYDHMEGVRFRHTAQFNRWRPDREPRSCTYAQLDQPVTFSLGDIVPGLLPERHVMGGGMARPPRRLRGAALRCRDAARMFTVRCTHRRVRRIWRDQRHLHSHGVVSGRPNAVMGKGSGGSGSACAGRWRLRPGSARGVQGSGRQSVGIAARSLALA
ncbi:hypothetical protein IWGMT90018_60290 [Mycobacterium kiyosense]|nr:hypothetical protein IWGMT90018_60290 [Mycobacterium kiyosense]